MNKNKKTLYYWLGGLLVLALVVGVAVWSQGSQFQGMLRLSQVQPISTTIVKTPVSNNVTPVKPALQTQVPATPTMLTPVNGSTVNYADTGVNGAVVFSWNSVPNAVKYDLVLQQNNSTTDSKFHPYTTTSTSYSMPMSSLQPGGYYMWFVRAYNSTGIASDNPANYWTFTITQVPVATICPYNLAVNLSAAQPQGGNVSGGQEVSLGKWDFKSATALKLNQLTFSTYSLAAINRVTLYMNGTQIGDIPGYVAVQSKVIVNALNLNLPAGVSTTIEARGTSNSVPNDGVSLPLAGDKMGLKLTSIDNVLDNNGNNAACGITNNASNTWGPLYTLQAGNVQQPTQETPSYPSVTLNPLPGNTLADGAVISAFRIAPNYGPIYFISGASHIIINYYFGDPSSVMSGTCNLEEQGGPIVASVLGPATQIGTIDFTKFNNGPYSIASSKDFVVKCNGMTLTPGSGITLSTRITTAGGTQSPIQWNDGVNNVTNAGLAMFPSDLGPQTLSI